jgi:hypothetical protein
MFSSSSAYVKSISGEFPQPVHDELNGYQQLARPDCENGSGANAESSINAAG